MHKVIIIEDEQDISELIQLHLEDMDCETAAFRDGKAGYDYAIQNKFDLMILDVNLPSKNGIDICRDLRANKVFFPILMLTARSEEIDKVLGLETGADDYLTKPFSIRELVARVRAILRRSQLDAAEEEEASEVIEYKNLRIDRTKRKVEIKGERIELTPKEFDLLYLLASNPGVTYDRKDLLNLVWSYDFEGYEHTVNSHINRLRAKVEIDPAEPEYVLTTWGVGYRFDDA
ncbi:MAG: DNA-binding response OmpR family regulator [Flavobacteriales bacterium]|jgi:two-component system alkaline phosphatase synthesis response regulator PhoP